MCFLNPNSLWGILILCCIKLNAQPELPEYLNDLENLDIAGDFPINLGDATNEQLFLMNFLSADDIAELLRYREKYGPIISRYELQAIPGFSKEKILRLQSYFRIPESPFGEASMNAGLKPEAFEVTLLSEKNFGQENSGIHTRGRIQAEVRGGWVSGLRFDQDPGESWKFKPSKGYWGADHVNFFIRKNGYGLVKRFIVGDFRVHTGYGLVHQASFLLGKGSYLPLPSSGSFISHNGTFSESGGMSGSAVTIGKGQWNTSGYFSYSRRDATVYDGNTFRSFSSSGIHNDEASVHRRKSIGILSVGNFAEYRSDQWLIGYSVNCDRLTHSLINKDLYKKPLPEGKSFLQYSVFANYRFQNLRMWFEFAGNPSGSKSWISGISSSIGRHLELVFLLRKYDPGYFTIYGNGFSETGSGNRNEHGTYFGLRYSIRKQITLTAYADLYKIPWFSYRHNSSVRGRDGRLDLSLTLSPVLNLRVLTKAETRDQSPGLKHTITTFKHQLHLTFRKNSHELRIRVQFNRRKIMDDERGWLISADWITEQPRTTWNLRMMFFQTDSYYTREFTFERDVWGSFSLPSYYGKGYRTIILIRHRFNRKIMCWLRWAMTVSLPRHTGSGEHELKIQLKYSL